MGIIAVSDVHLGYFSEDKKNSLSDKKGFLDFLGHVETMDGIEHLVLCGDILDMWRRDMVGVTLENLDVLDKLQDLSAKRGIHVHYLAGNHDYHVFNLKRPSYPFGFAECASPRVGISIPDGGKIYHFKHGYDLEPLMAQSEYFFDLMCSTSDEAGEFKSNLYDSLGQLENLGKHFLGTADEYVKNVLKNPLKRPIPGGNSTDNLLPDKNISIPIEKRMALGNNGFDFSAFKLPAKEILVFGHTHKPFHSQNVINLGSWITAYPVHSTYLEIRDGKEELKTFPEEKPEKVSALPKSVEEMLYVGIAR